MDLIKYPPVTGSPRLIEQFRYQALPDWWVGRTRHVSTCRTLAQALKLNDGETSKIIRLVDPRIDVHIDLTSAGLRSVQSSKHISRVGLEPSAKARIALQTESRPERWFANLSELDPGIVDIRTQCVRVGNTERFITFDAIRLTAGGRIQVVEVKSNSKRIGTPKYIEKLNWAKAVCEQIGFEFVLATTECFATRNVLEHNVRVISIELFTEIMPRTVGISNLAVAAGQNRAGYIFEKLGGDNFARSQILAMLARGRICCDLSRRLTTDTLVWKNTGRIDG